MQAFFVLFAYMNIYVIFSLCRSAKGIVIVKSIVFLLTEIKLCIYIFLIKIYKSQIISIKGLKGQKRSN